MDHKSLSVLILGGAALLAALMAPGQDGRQEWRMSPAGRGDRVHFTIEHWKGGSHSSTSTDVQLDRFRGFNPSLFDHAGDAQFEYVHDAGRLVCKGHFSFGRGAGNFTFTPDPSFVAALQKLGYDAPREEQLFTMMMVDVGLDFARTVSEAGLHATTDQLIELRIHGVNAEYIRETQRAGYTKLSANDYVQMKIHGVQPSFLRDLKAAGYELDSRQVVELRIHGVSSEFLRDLKDYGLQPRAADMVQMKIHGVSADYLKGLKDAGYGDLSTDQIVQLRIHGVSTDFVQDAKSLGYNFSAQDTVELRIHGVDSAYLRRLRDSGMRNLSAAQIVKLRIHGVD